MPPAVMNAVFLGTVGHLAANISADFTNGMVHAFLVSVVICALAVVFSLVREGRQPARSATSSPSATSPARTEESAGARTAGGQ